MWVAEGLTHRYPTKVLAELLLDLPAVLRALHPHGPGRQLHPARSTSSSSSCKPSDRYDAMIDYLRHPPAVRDVVVSGGDVANVPWPRLEAFLTGLLEIENIRDIRLATKALMGLPQHWLQDDVVEGMAGSPRTARARGVNLAIHTHVNHAQSVTPAGRRGRPDDARRRRARRAQPGRADARRQRRRRGAARPVLRAAGRRQDHAVLLLHVRHDPERRALAGLACARPSSCSTTSWATCPASPRRASSATCRSSASAGCTSSPSTTERGISYWTKNYRTSIEATDPEALTRRYEYYDPIDTLPAEGQQWWREHVLRPQGRRGRRGLAPDGGAAGVLRGWGRRCHRLIRPVTVPTPTYTTDRPSYGVDSTIVVRVETLAAKRIGPGGPRGRRGWGTRILRM